MKILPRRPQKIPFFNPLFRIKSYHHAHLPGKLEKWICVAKGNEVTLMGLEVCVCSIMPNSLWHHGLWPAHPPLSMGFSRQVYWSGLPFPSPGESSWPRDWICVSCVSCICGWILYQGLKREVLKHFGLRTCFHY